MAKERLVGVWAGGGWNLREYAWRSRCVRSPLTGKNVRAIVARDDKGFYHPGLRNSGEHGSEFKTVYEDFTSYRDRDFAIGEAKQKLIETLDSHKQTQDHLAEATPVSGTADREVADSDGNGFKLKSIVWRSEPSTSPLTGRSIRSVVGTDENGSFRVARRTGRMGGDRFEMVFAREVYSSKEAAISASREMKVDFIRGEAEGHLRANNRGGQEIFRVDSIEGWRAGAKSGDAPNSFARQLFESFDKKRASPPESPSRSRPRSIER
jgi:hypothetical protein